MENKNFKEKMNELNKDNISFAKGCILLGVITLIIIIAFSILN
ncbi:MAG: hypothetical protein PHQ89_05175 [Bacilli bacterium]|nr:hypothetical protein [Bacilli bacterium]